ncbi:MAG: helix-turn-helix domain-containing protein [Chloroflexota bacterium]|nr:helix-turn-helix domain-containing protein [Chloroflexota bacterium]
MALPDIHWITTGEAAKRLGISREWARQLVQRGVLTGRATHVGLLIDPASVEAYAVERNTAVRMRVAGKIAAVVQDAERGQSSLPAGTVEQLRRARAAITPVSPHPFWQEQTGFTAPADVLDWLREARERVNGGQPLPGNSTELIRAFREGTHGDA